MSSAVTRKRHQGIALCAFLLAAFSCAFGLSFCLVKSPEARSEAYLAVAMEAYDNARTADAAAAAMEAVRLHPVAHKGWQILSKMLHKNGQETAARQAGMIAAKLQHNPASPEPLYAMPAELKLSFLAGTNADIP